MNRKLIYIFILLFVFGLTACDGTDISETTNLEQTTIQETTEGESTTEDLTTIEATTEDLSTSQPSTTDPLSTEQPSTGETTTSEVTTSIPSTTEDLTTTMPVTTDEVTTSIPTTTEEVTELRDSYYQYSIHSTQNIKILHLDITDDVIAYSTSYQMIDIDDILLKTTTGYEIKSDYIISTYGDGGYQYMGFYLEFNNQRTLVQIAFNDKEIPYIISSSVVYTDGNENLLFQFELFGGIIKQVNANGMASTDYLITDNALVIMSDYVSRMFVENDEFIISYTLEDESLVIGMISVNKEE
jgi:hypothetical protein